VDERLTQHLPLLLVGSITTAVLVCGGLAQLCVGRLVERFSAHNLFAAITGLGFLGNLWAAYADGIPLLIALAVAIAAIYGQVTVNDIVLARYTADAWRGRVYAVRYFLLFISAAAAIGMISLLHEHGGFGLVLGVNAVIALVIFVATVALAIMINSLASQWAAAPAE
jgi:MFS family permease